MDSVTQVVAYLKKQPGFSDLWADLDENSLHRGDIRKASGSYHTSEFCQTVPLCQPAAENFHGPVF